jgi:hypothetical protein
MYRIPAIQIRLTAGILAAIGAVLAVSDASAQTSTATERSNQIKLKIGSNNFIATLEDNATTRAFRALLPMTVNMTELNGNEKYFRFSNALPTSASNPGKIQSGDLMVYGSTTLVLFYKSFPTSYDYTRLGRIKDVTELAKAVGLGNVSVTFAVE